MAADSQSSEDIVVQDFVVCLMDILGQEARLQGWSELPADGHPTDDFVSAVAGSLGAVRKLRNDFRDFFSQFNDVRVTTDHLTPEQRSQFFRLRECRLAIQQFSDTVVFYAPLRNEHGDVSGSALYRMIGAAALGLLRGLADGTPIRGAISVGTGTEIEQRDFYGPALAKAHSLENSIAGYPRVVLSKRAAKLVRKSSGFSRDPEIERLMRQDHPSLSRLVHGDLDGRTIVDFLGAGMQATLGGQAIFVRAVGAAHTAARVELRRAIEDGNHKLTNRYSWLLSYIEPGLASWGIPSEGAGGG